ncbi:hypothetical protein [Alsobacter sp. R-9]
MLDWIITGFSYLLVFWLGYFVAAAMAVAKESDEQVERRYAGRQGH